LDKRTLSDGELPDEWLWLACAPPDLRRQPATEKRNDYDNTHDTKWNADTQTLAGNILQNCPRNQAAEQARRKNHELQIMDECAPWGHRRENCEKQYGGGKSRTTAMPLGKARKQQQSAPTKAYQPQKEFIKTKNRSAQFNQHPRRFGPRELAISSKANTIQNGTSLS
jgi:hypothetical protein